MSSNFVAKQAFTKPAKANTTEVNTNVDRTIQILIDSGRQFHLFLIGALVTLPSIFIWRKIILG